MENQNKFWLANNSVNLIFLAAFFIPGLSGRHHQLLCGKDVVRSTASISTIKTAVFYPFQDEAQTALFKDPVRTAM
jgi:hypothetical protein